MHFSRLLPIVVLACVFAMPVPKVSADPLTENYAICINSKGTKQQIVDACTWLIDNAAKENALVGYFYGIRASTSDNKASNCRDARKLRQLNQEPKMVEAANTLIKLNCS